MEPYCIDKRLMGVSGFKVSAKDRDAIQKIQKMALQSEFDILLVFMFGIIHRALHNSIYTGVIQNGESESEVLPDLKMIEEDLFSRAQVIAQERNIQPREILYMTRE